MADGLLDEVLGENERLKKHITRIEAEKQALVKRNARSESEISFLETFIEGLQSTIAVLRKELGDTNIQTMKALRLMARNLDRIKQENEVLQANQEIHMGVIDDLKGENLQEKMEKNQMEKQCTNTTALFASFDSFPEPWMMELKHISHCQSAPECLDNFRSTTSC